MPGAAGGMVCVFGLPALMHGKVHWQRGTLTPTRALVVAVLCAFGGFTLAMQLVPPPITNATHAS